MRSDRDLRLASKVCLTSVTVRFPTFRPSLGEFLCFGAGNYLRMRGTWIHVDINHFGMGNAYKSLILL